jgi:hypothetical protein
MTRYGNKVTQSVKIDKSSMVMVVSSDDIFFNV